MNPPSSHGSFQPMPVDPRHLEHVSIRASAGSGKTFQLTNRYLQLVAAGADVRSILASTFTRLAAGQIRNRILLRLARAIDSEKERAELAKHLGTPALSREVLLHLLTRLARNLHQMQIRTLDSFFASVVHAFAIELDLPIGADVVDEHQAQQMRTDAIRLLLDERDPQTLITLLRDLTQGSSERGVADKIDGVVNDLYAMYSEAAPEAWDHIPNLPTLDEASLNEAIDRLRSYTPPNDKNWQKAHSASVASVWRRDWMGFISKGLPSKIIAGTANYYKKPIDATALDAYTPLIEHARGVLIGRVRAQTLATRDLLALYHKQYERVKHQRRALTFDDLTGAMVKAERLGTLDTIGFRLDVTLHHLLLDEFQDTSVQQWHALQPIAHELVSYAPPQRTFFCVGDVKQSIYTWRDAAPEVLDDLLNLLRGPDGSSAIAERTLAKSYRSSPIVMDAVNTVFESLQKSDALAEYPEAVEIWNAGFTHHETAKSTLPGRVELRTVAQAETGPQRKSLRLNAAAELAMDLHNQQPDIQIAILTRTNDAVAKLQYELGPSRRNIAGGVSGRGGGPLTDAPAVNTILDLLHLADHPDDTIAAFHVANTPLGHIVDFTDYKHDGRRRAVARYVRSRLVHAGYSRTIAEWAAGLDRAKACDARERRRVMQLVNLATAYESTGSPVLRTADFIDMVETTNVPDIRPAAVQVMTIHQSKGLEFDIVILPELDVRMSGNSRPPVVFERENDTGPIVRICQYVSESVRSLAPELTPLFERHRLRTVRESLSLLYVAMTRAIHGLYMIIDPQSDREQTMPKTMAGVVRCALAEGAAPANETLYAHGSLPKTWTTTRKDTRQKNNTIAREATPSVASTAPATSGIILAKLGHDALILRGISAPPASAAPSHHTHAPAHQSSAGWLALEDDEPRDRGVALHALFEQIEWLDDDQPDAMSMQRIVRSAVPRRDGAWVSDVVREFETMLTNPSVRKLLSQKASDTNGADRLRVFREHPFTRTTEQGIQSGFIDRVVVHLNEKGHPTAAEVIDFKTGSATHRDSERYRPQLLAYQQVIAAMLQLPPDHVAMTVLECRGSDALAIRL